MKIFSSTLVGVKPIPVEIEIDLSPGLPFFQIVGLPDLILRESKTRVKSAIIQSGFDFPYDRRLVLNLSPSKIRKEGSGFELALAVRILTSSGQIPFSGEKPMFLGELALDGTIRNVDETGALAFAAGQVPDLDFLVVPKDAAARIASSASCPVFAIDHLRDLQDPEWWNQKGQIPEIRDLRKLLQNSIKTIYNLEFSEFWARHLKIAAVGRHHYLLSGPPGSGKTYFAESLRLFLGVVTKKKDTNQKILDALFERASEEFPWAAPHHSVTTASLLGGGNHPKPGAITRAHGGVLFLDELLEFSPSVLDSLREPLEHRQVDIYRAGSQVSFPGDVQLIAATNPCRCGDWGHPVKRCKCHATHRRQYRSRMSGPFFDRFDVRVFCPPPLGNENNVSGRKILEAISQALEFKNKTVTMAPTDKARLYLDSGLGKLLRNKRRQIRVINLASTLALLELSENVDSHHIEEALSYQEIPELEDNP